MVLFSLLAIITVILLIATVAVVAFGGAVGVILFSDVIVCMAIFVFILKKLIKKKK